MGNAHCHYIFGQILVFKSGFACTWTVLEFQNKNSRLWKSLKNEVSAGKSLNFGAITLSNPDSQVTERSKHRKTFRIKLLMCGRTGKDIDSGLLFALNGILKKWEIAPSKSLNFLFKKGYKPCSILFSKITSSMSLCKEIQKSLLLLNFRIVIFGKKCTQNVILEFCIFV